MEFPIDPTSHDFSPVIAEIHPDDRPQPLPVCSDCPAGNWLKTNEMMLGCWCSVRGELVYTDSHWIEACDIRSSLLKANGQRLSLITQETQQEAEITL